MQATDDQIIKAKFLAFNLCGLSDPDREALAAVLDELAVLRKLAAAVEEHDEARRALDAALQAWKETT